MTKRFLLLLICCTINFSLKAQEAKAQEVEDSTIFVKVEEEATFPGGTEGWKMYLQKNLRADIPLKKKAPAGTYTVVVRFIVDKKGNISNVSAETNLGFGMENEVIRVIKKGPKWIPSIQNGKVVKAYRRQPITFLVSEE
jgi:periplasmic protein TonB